MILLEYTGMGIILKLRSFSISIINFKGNVIVFYGSFRRLCIVIIVNVSINLICGE